MRVAAQQLSALMLRQPWYLLRGEKEHCPVWEDRSCFVAAVERWRPYAVGWRVVDLRLPLLRLRLRAMRCASLCPAIEMLEQVRRPQRCQAN